MKQALVILLLLSFEVAIKANGLEDYNPDYTPDTNHELFRTKLSRATLAVYQGKQKCEWVKKAFFIFTIDVWNCHFDKEFVCTATVVDNVDDEYEALTAGHCFDWETIDDYYIGDNVTEHPVLHHAQIKKFENGDEYDYALVKFKSVHPYPVIEIGVVEATNLRVGTPVINVNYSYGIVKQYTEGKISSELIRVNEGPQKNLRGRYFVNVGVGPGASGSAIVDPETESIVGIVEAIFPETTMPTLVEPTGESFLNFYDDDSIGLKPLPQGPKPDNKDSNDEDTKVSLARRILNFILKLLSI